MTSIAVLTAPTEEGSRYHSMRMSEAEYLVLPEEKPGLEFHDGLVIQKAMANADHRRLSGEFDFRFALMVRTAGGDFGPEGRVRLSTGRYRLPDTAAWAPGVPSGDDSMPTVAVEVRSPDESMASQRAKCRLYRQSGVPVVWLVDPRTRTVEIFEDDRDGTVLRIGDTLTTPHLPGFSLPLAELFAVLDR